MTVHPPPRPVPPGLDDRLAALEDRQLARRQVLAAARASEAALRALLSPPPPRPTSWWVRVRRRWAPAPTPVHPDAAAERYEEVLRAVRPLGFHLVSLEQAAADAEHDVHASVLLLRSALADQAGATPGSPTAGRLAATAQRCDLLRRVLEAEADVLATHHATLVELHHAANDVVRALGRQALALAAGQSSGAETACVDAVVRRAVERAAELHHRADTHEARLAELDAEARARLAARAEVEGWLSRSTTS